MLFSNALSLQGVGTNAGGINNKLEEKQRKSSTEHDEGDNESDDEESRSSISVVSEDHAESNKDVDFMEQYDDALLREVQSMMAKSSSEQKQEHEELRETEPACIDQQLMDNIVKSYTAQSGAAGPASNIIAKLGYGLPEETITG